MDICREYAPVVEKASIDECYLDMSGTHRIYPDPVALAHTIKDRIRNEFGFTVNVGIGENKLLAKMASDFEKPDKVHTLFLSEIPQKMWPLPVGELFTVGGATADKLRQAKIMTIGDLAHTDLARVQKIVGMKMGKHIHDYANGIDPSPVLAEPEEAKGYSISTTLEEDVKKATQAYPVLLALADSVTARIRSDGAKAYCIAVTIRDNSCVHNASFCITVFHLTRFIQSYYFIYFSQFAMKPVQTFLMVNMQKSTRWSSAQFAIHRKCLPSHRIEIMVPQRP